MRTSDRVITRSVRPWEEKKCNLSISPVCQLLELNDQYFFQINYIAPNGTYATDIVLLAQPIFLLRCQYFSCYIKIRPRVHIYHRIHSFTVALAWGLTRGLTVEVIATKQRFFPCWLRIMNPSESFSWVVTDAINLWLIVSAFSRKLTF